MRNVFRRLVLPMALGLVPVSVSAQTGAEIYEDVCARCHGLFSSWHVPDGAQLAVVLPQGPTLNGIVGRPVGIIEGYQYSKGMRAFAATGAVWDRETLDKFITNSRTFVKGTTMIVRLKENERALVLDHLEAVSPYTP